MFIFKKSDKLYTSESKNYSSEAMGIETRSFIQKILPKQSLKRIEEIAEKAVRFGKIWSALN